MSGEKGESAQRVCVMIWPADSPHLRISVLFVRWLTDLLLSCLVFVHRRGEGIREETVRSWHNLFLYVRFFPFHKLSSSPPLLSGNTSFYNTHHFSHGNRAEQTVAFTKSPSQPNSYLREPQENDVLLFPVQQRFSHHTLSQFIWPISRTWDAKPVFIYTWRHERGTKPKSALTPWGRNNGARKEPYTYARKHSNNSFTHTLHCHSIAILGQWTG